MGVQHINNPCWIVYRHCPTWKTIEAIRMLNDNYFKIDIHLMPDLPKPYLPDVDASADDFELTKVRYVL